MKNMKKLLSIIAIVGVVGMATTAYAADIKSPSDIVSAITGKSSSDVQNEKSNGKTYGTIAKESGKLAEFKTEMLKQKKAVLDQRVKDGYLTQEKADEIYSSLKNNQSTCDGDGNGQIGKKFGVGFGKGNGNCAGKGNGNGNRQNNSCGNNCQSETIDQ